ncbi:hypothetical protein Xcel_2871 [Xylanimonas cellulosilytica DSM 15894]|uniref:CRISPR-associated protein, Cse3 family n=1 Tax=Xylanimonas cellulosilytica (strain DSM 15894 / JCM 12276 / CECT 5975 / KCTC 9989 / LMG 20990 / NBRC 107835 / XIL07) TaxID=446471 RepID=D1BYL2_XYLCX|nr:type I-E CRISPR-associated protein Cas6/Cse3/CasE [Xylanimonas cellulosilytica]ACZ31884.1 hypothetical protein Xcel_2871 [Xylanimonas cellulosilytica DSM 15894]
MADLFDTTLTVPATMATALLSDRTTGHRMTMQLWDQIESTVHRGARAHVGCLWRVTGIDPVAQTGTLLVRSSTAPTRKVPWAIQQDAAVTELPETGATVDLTVTIAAMYTPMYDVPVEWRENLKAGADGTARPPGEGLSYRSKQVPVPSDRLQEWSVTKLKRLGVDGDVVAHAAPVVRIKGALVATAHLSVTGATVNDGLEQCVRTGIGKGRSYGLGLVAVTPRS